MQLNADQEAAAEQIFSFLMSGDKEMALSGPPGVGKTFLLQHIVKKLMPYYKQACDLMGIPRMIEAVKLTATTNRAAEVLSGAMNHEAGTIHSLLGLRVFDDYETGKQKIQRTSDYHVHSRTLILIDEASMIDRDLYKVLTEGTDQTCKIIYIGDHCQLAPVGEKLSVVFSKTDIPMVTLTTPVRNANQPALMDLCAQLRETVETGVFKPIQAVPGVIDYPSDAEMQALVEQTFTQEGADSRLLAYTNSQVHAYNDFIRKLRGYSEHYEVDELVVNNTGINLPRKQGFLFAEREFRVASIGRTIDFDITPDYKIEALEYALRDTKTGQTLNVFQPKSREEYHTAVRHYKRHQLWVPYYKLKNNFPDLRPRDASTVYKAQGSTFDSVFIDLENIGTATQSDQAARMIYVAVSRAKSRVYLYGRLPHRFGG